MEMAENRNALMTSVQAPDAMSAHHASMKQPFLTLMDRSTKLRPGILSQGKQLADFDTRSILETADARAATADAPRKAGVSPRARPSKRQRAGSSPRSLGPSASHAQGETSRPGTRSYHSLPACPIPNWGQVKTPCLLLLSMLSCRLAAMTQLSQGLRLQHIHKQAV